MSRLRSLPKLITALIVIGVILTSGAVVALLVSNTLVIHSSVHDTGATVSVGQPLSGLPTGWASYEALPASPITGVTYALPLHVQGNADVTAAAFHISVSKTSISPSDINLQYWSGSSWTTATLADAGSSLTIVTDSMTLAQGSSAYAFLLITFNTQGEYDESFWMEG